MDLLSKIELLKQELVERGESPDDFVLVISFADESELFRRFPDNDWLVNSPTGMQTYCHHSVGEPMLLPFSELPAFMESD